MNFLLGPLAVIGGMGALFGVALGFAQKVLYVEGNPLADEILEELPGANCGGCGFAGCGAYAEAVAEGNAPPTACSVGGKAVAEKIAEKLGVDASTMVKKVAFVKCGGACDKSSSRYDYSGIFDCTAAAMLAGGGSKDCQYGCVGLGTCARVCNFDAIRFVNDLAIIDPDKCVACGACVKACPKALIELAPYTSGTKVLCNSNDKGKDVKEKCSVGCIGCMLCKKNCEYDAITVENSLAKIDFDKCTNCGVCVTKCPTEAIRFSLRRKDIDE